MTYYGGPFSDTLLEVPVPIWDLENCISRYSQSVFDTNICAAGYEGKKDSCSVIDLIMYFTNLSNFMSAKLA